MTTSDPTLVCLDCGATYEDRWRCRCGGVLDYADRPLPDGPAPEPSAVDTRAGLWSFSAFLPMEAHATLGEGMTPLVDADAGGATRRTASGGDGGPTPNDAVGDTPAWNAQFKLEYVFPTGSFKDRGATTTISRAVERGVDRVVEDSSGNAGAAIATYAARAGIDAEIYVPASVKESKLTAIRAAGARPVPIEGGRQAVTDACVEAVEAGDAWYASHAWNPAFFAGTATIAYEIALQRDWRAPDAIVTPLGHGTLFLGAYRGFKALFDAGWIDRVPKLLGAQAAGFAPIAAERHGGDSGGRNDVADGIQIAAPTRREQILEAIEATDGDAIALPAAAVETELDRLHRRGFYTEPTSAIAPAALRAYRERGVVDDADDVVVPLTGSGLKT
ncbi:pyridoxal-phosphate dependent enzyme [Haloferacaceae archaeon DSL9]